jgi:hypothetical protein
MRQRRNKRKLEEKKSIWVEKMVQERAKKCKSILVT